MNHVTLFDFYSGVHLNRYYGVVRIIVKAMHHSGKDVDAVSLFQFHISKGFAFTDFDGKHTADYGVVLISFLVRVFGKGSSGIEHNLSYAATLGRVNNFSGSPRSIANGSVIEKVVVGICIFTNNTFDVICVFLGSDIGGVVDVYYQKVGHIIGNHQATFIHIDDSCVDGVFNNGRSFGLTHVFTVCFEIRNILPVTAQANYGYVVRLFQKAFFDTGNIYTVKEFFTEANCL